MNKLLLGLFPLVALAHQTNAQTRAITGRVTDRATGEGIPGVTIVVLGTTTGVSTGADGSFTLDLPANAKILRFSSVGYESQERPVGADGKVNIALSPDTKQIGEVVVTGYGGSQDIKDITGSYAKLDQSKLTSQPVQSADQALAGRIAGVQITNTSGTLGDAVTVRIRGINSVNGSSQPLFVVDGVPMTEFGNFNILTDGLRYNPLADINPNDIESMTVLKDASAAAIYGSRATNGVIIITTKRGKKGMAKLSVNASAGFMEATRLPKLLNAAEFRDITNEKYFNANTNATDPIIPQFNDVNQDGVPDETNWLKQVYHRGKMQDYQLALTSGNDFGSYYASVGYSDLNGSIKNNRLRRANARLNFELTPKTWVKAGVSMGFSHAYNQGVLTDKYLAGATVAAYNAPPNVPAYGPDGSYYLNTAGDIGNGQVIDAAGNLVSPGNNYGTAWVVNRFFHPVANLELQHNDNTQRRLLGNSYLTFTLTKGLTLTSKFGLDYLNNSEYQYSDAAISGLGRYYPGSGLVQRTRADNTLTTWQNYASYNRIIGENHNLDATVGYEQNVESYQSVYGSAASLVDPKFKDILDGLFDPVLSSQGGSRDVTAWQSGFSRVNYSYSDKYYATLTARYDGSSRFGNDARYGFFPGASVGWRISREGFMSRFGFLNDLKLRASYGLVGNSAGISSYASAILIGQGQYASFPGLNINQLSNSKLRWETGKKLDVGFDLSVVKDRIGVVFDYFNSNIDNLLLGVPAVQSTGVPNIPGTGTPGVVRNVGKMWNRGAEVTLNTTNVELPNGFKWTSSLNYSYVKNRITDFSTVGDINTSYPYAVASQGHSITEYRILRWVGVNPQNGNPQWLDKNGNLREYQPGVNGAVGVWYQNGEALVNGQKVQPATSASDGVWIGKQRFPKWFGGFDNTFSYKGLQLEVFLQYSGGNYLYNLTRASMLTNYISNNFAEIRDRWTTPGQVTNVPKPYITDNTANNSSTRFMEKGDFLRVRQVRLSYVLPTAVSQKFGTSRANVFLMVQNAYVFTKYSGTDPEVNSAANEGRDSNIAYGVDNRANPQVRTFTGGVNLDF